MPPFNPYDVSGLLFGKTRVKKPYIGPLQISRDEKKGICLVASRKVEAGELLLLELPVASVQGSKSQEEANQSLLKVIKNLVAGKNDPKLVSICCLHGCRNRIPPTMDALLRRSNDITQPPALTDDEILDIIKKNAFGPEFLGFSRLRPRDRALGLYPVASLLNHSCSPNALKVYAQEVMIVHAAQNIEAGQAVEWAYLPATLPYPQRLGMLHQAYDFVCDCPRCVEESKYWTEDLKDLTALQTLLEITSLSNQTKRYLRTSFAQYYMDYLNQATDESTETLLNLCSDLHFSFLTCNPSCTEHISVRIVDDTYDDWQDAY